MDTEDHDRQSYLNPKSEIQNYQVRIQLKLSWFISNSTEA